MVTTMSLLGVCTYSNLSCFRFRLACMNVLAFDFEYAASKNVEQFLWQVHTFLNGEYRKVMGRLLAQNQVVVRRKLEKQYRGFLRTAQSFYRVYIQRLSSRFHIPELHQVAHGTDVEPETIPLLIQPLHHRSVQ